MKQRPRADVTDAELAVLKILWDRGPSTIRLLTDLLYPDGGTAQYATVQKLLERLEGKACVRRKSDGRANVWSAAIGLDDLIGRRLRETAEKLCEGSLTPLLTHLANVSELSAKDLDALRELIRRLDDESGRG